LEDCQSFEALCKKRLIIDAPEDGGFPQLGRRASRLEAEGNG
jgi:hypothetical protein